MNQKIGWTGQCQGLCNVLPGQWDSAPFWHWLDIYKTITLRCLLCGAQAILAAVVHQARPRNPAKHCWLLFFDFCCILCRFLMSDPSLKRQVTRWYSLKSLWKFPSSSGPFAAGFVLPRIGLRGWYVRALTQFDVNLQHAGRTSSRPRVMTVMRCSVKSYATGEMPSHASTERCSYLEPSSPVTPLQIASDCVDCSGGHSNSKLLLKSLTPQVDQCLFCQSWTAEKARISWSWGDLHRSHFIWLQYHTSTIARFASLGSVAQEKLLNVGDCVGTPQFCDNWYECTCI